MYLNIPVHDQIHFNDDIDVVPPRDSRINLSVITVRKIIEYVYPVRYNHIPITYNLPEDL